MDQSSRVKSWYPEWEILDELQIAKNSRKRFVYTLKKLKNKNQLYLDFGAYGNDSQDFGRYTGLCMHLPTAIDFLAALDEILNRAKSILNEPQYAQAYGLVQNTSNLGGVAEQLQQFPKSRQRYKFHLYHGVYKPGLCRGIQRSAAWCVGPERRV